LRAAEALEQELELSDALVSALSYPAFLILMFVAAFLVLLVFVVPALGPLVQQSGAEAPVFMSALLKLSSFLIEHGLAITLSICALGGVIAGAWRFNLLRAPLESWLLDGPLKGIVRGLVFGGVASVFGGLVASRVPAPEALQLSLRSANMGLARRRLVQSAILIRDGVAVSQALRRCKGMPVSVIRLASIGEEVGRLGPLVQRAGRLEQARNLRALKAISQWLGPAMIVLLGGVIGLVMAGLLTSITTMGSEITR
jgi:type II secretory pathway component PulF